MRINHPDYRQSHISSEAKAEAEKKVFGGDCCVVVILGPSGHQRTELRRHLTKMADVAGPCLTVWPDAASAIDEIRCGVGFKHSECVGYLPSTLRGGCWRYIFMEDAQHLPEPPSEGSAIAIAENRTCTFPNGRVVVFTNSYPFASDVVRRFGGEFVDLSEAA